MRLSIVSITSTHVQIISVSHRPLVQEIILKWDDKPQTNKKKV